MNPVMPSLRAKQAAFLTEYLAAWIQAKHFSTLHKGAGLRIYAVSENE